MEKVSALPIALPLSMKTIQKIDQFDAYSREPLLENGDFKTYTTSSNTWRQRLPHYFFVHIAIVLGYSTVFLLAWLMVRSQYIHGPAIIYDPARKAIEYETKVFDHTQVFFNITPKPYSGVPDPRKEEAWEDLLKNFNIRVTEDEMRTLGKQEDNLPLPDGGYFGSLTVFHQLHCIWRVHTALYPKYYWADLSEEEQFLNLGHSEHCLDVLRQSILCNADTSMITMKWDKYSPSPVADSTNLHECVSWDAINNWAAQRSFDPFKPGYLMHPTLGVAYPNDTGGRIGVAVSSNNKHFDENKIKEILKYTGR